MEDSGTSAICVSVGFGAWVKGSMGITVVLGVRWPTSPEALCLKRDGLGKTLSSRVVVVLVPRPWFSSEAVASPSTVGSASCIVPPIAASSFVPCTTLLVPAVAQMLKYNAKTMSIFCMKYCIEQCFQVILLS